jgi:hypothetical protein
MGQRDLDSSLHFANSDVLKANGPLGLAYLIAPTGIPASRVLDNQSRFGVTSAFLRAIRQLSDSTCQLRRRKNLRHRPRRRSERHCLHQTKLQASCPLLVTLAYTKSRSPPSARAAICVRMSRANYCAVLNHPVHSTPFA